MRCDEGTETAREREGREADEAREAEEAESDASDEDEEIRRADQREIARGLRLGATVGGWR